MYDSVFKPIWKIWEWGIGRTIMATIAAHTNSISVGMCQGYSAVLIPQLQASDYAHITQDDASWIASLGVISTPGGAILAGLLTEVVGRKTAVQLTSVPFLIGWAIIAFSTGKFSLYLGRFISGLAIGMASACYVYVAEITHPDQRGLLSAFGPIFVSLGVLIVYSLGYLMSWQSVSAICAAVAVFSFSAVHLIPETPSWLVSKKKIPEAKKALVWLRRNPAQADEELGQLLLTVKSTQNEEEEQQRCKHFMRNFIKPCVWKPFLILIVFFLFQEGTGMYVVLYYAVNVFQQLGSSMNDYVASIAVALVRLIMSILGSICIQHFNRRTLAMFSGFGMAVSMGIVGTYEYLYESLPVEKRPYSWTPLVGILFNVCASMLGMLQLPWLMIGELFPLAVRGFMGGVVSSLAYIFIFGVVKIYPNIHSTLDMHGTMWLFTAASFAVIVYVNVFLPETRGKTLLEIEMEFMGQGKSDVASDLENGQNKTDNIIYCIGDKGIK